MRSLETAYGLFGNNTGTQPVTPHSPQIWPVLFISIYILIVIVIILIFDTHFKRKSKFKYEELAKTISKNDWSAMETLERRMRVESASNFAFQLWIFWIVGMGGAMLMAYFFWGVQ